MYLPKIGGNQSLRPYIPLHSMRLLRPDASSGIWPCCFRKQLSTSSITTNNDLVAYMYTTEKCKYTAIMMHNLSEIALEF